MRLKQLRKDKKIKQSDLAIMLNITTKSYQNYELELRRTPLDILITLADYYNVTLDHLVGREFLGGQQVTEEEYELLELFRQLTGSEQKRLIGYAKFQTSMEENLQENKKINAKLTDLSKKIFAKNNVVISFSGDKDTINVLKNECKKLKLKLVLAPKLVSIAVTYFSGTSINLPKTPCIPCNLILLITFLTL